MRDQIRPTRQGFVNRKKTNWYTIWHAARDEIYHAVSTTSLQTLGHYSVLNLMYSAWAIRAKLANREWLDMFCSLAPDQVRVALID